MCILDCRPADVQLFEEWYEFQRQWHQVTDEDEEYYDAVEVDEDEELAPLFLEDQQEEEGSEVDGGGAGAHATADVDNNERSVCN